MKSILVTIIFVFLIINGVFTNLMAQDVSEIADSSFSVLNDSINIDRVVSNVAFKKGEYLKFVIRYGPVKAGFAYMEIPDIVEINNKSSFHVISRAESNNFFSTFYKVRDKVESLIDTTGIFTWLFEKHLREGKFHADIINVFDQKNKRVFTRKDTFDVPLYVQDVLSALYYIRTQKLTVGESISVDNFSDGKKYPLEVKVLKKEKIRVKAGKFSCFVIEPILKSTGLFQQKGKLTVWMTEDPTHMPVQMKTEIVVGAIIAELLEYKGVKPVKE
jgi:hypothetical protein